MGSVTHRLQLFQNSFRDHNHTHKPHPNVIGHAPVTTPIVMKISHVNFICAATVAGKSGRKALYSTGGRGQVSENKWISILDTKWPVIHVSLASRTYNISPRASNSKLRTSRARRKIMYHVTLALTQNYASPRTAARWLVLTYVFLARGQRFDSCLVYFRDL